MLTVIAAVIATDLELHVEIQVQSRHVRIFSIFQDLEYWEYFAYFLSPPGCPESHSCPFPPRIPARAEYWKFVAYFLVFGKYLAPLPNQHGRAFFDSEVAVDRPAQIDRPTDVRL